MPGFDARGPMGRGPLTGRGGGYCGIRFPRFGRVPRGYVGLRRFPLFYGGRFARWLRPAFWVGRGRGAGRGRGWRSRWW